MVLKAGFEINIIQQYLGVPEASLRFIESFGLVSFHHRRSGFGRGNSAVSGGLGFFPRKGLIDKKLYFGKLQVCG